MVSHHAFRSLLLNATLVISSVCLTLAGGEAAFRAVQWLRDGTPLLTRA